MKIRASIGVVDDVKETRFFIECMNAYEEKEKLKEKGFKWNGIRKTWEKTFWLRPMTKEEERMFYNYENDDDGIVPEDMMVECQNILQNLGLKAEIEIL